MDKRRRPPCLDLPPDILQKIAESKGSSSVYHLRLRAVCKSWRSAMYLPKTPRNRGIRAPLLSQTLPLKIPVHPFMGNHIRSILGPSDTFLFLVATSSFVIQPTKGKFKDSPSLLMVDEINPGLLSTRYPLSSSLGSSWSSSSKFLDLFETRISLLAQGCCLRPLHVRRNASEREQRGEFEVPLPWRGFSKKALLVKNPSCEDDLVAMVLFDGWMAATFRVRDEVWKVVFDGKTSKCADIAEIKGKIYAIDHQGRAYFINYNYETSDLSIVEVASSAGGGGGKRLVVDTSSEELFMVVRRTGVSHFAFSVYKLTMEGDQVWEKVKNLGYRMLFVGNDVSFCASLSDLPWLRGSCMNSDPGNCIFFSKGSFPICDSYGDDGDGFLFRSGIDGVGMNIGQYRLNDRCATGLLEPAYVIMFSLQF